MSAQTFYIRCCDSTPLCKSERGMLSFSGEPITFSRYVHAHEYLAELLNNPEGLLGLKREHVALHIEPMPVDGWL
jgi:hypothetical protein